MDHLVLKKSPDTPGFLVQVDSDERVLQTVLQLFLVHPAGPKRLPRPSEVLFCDDKVPLAEVQAELKKSGWPTVLGSDVYGQRVKSLLCHLG